MPSQKDLAVAFALCAGAGLSTTIGAAFVFIPQFQNNATLGASLAFAAGVMIYVSMAEIAVKCYDEFELHFDDLDDVNRTAVVVDDYDGNTKAFHSAALTFFAGLAITAVLDWFVVWIRKECGEASGAGHNHNEHGLLFGESGAHPNLPSVAPPKAVESTAESTAEAAGTNVDEEALTIRSESYMAANPVYVLPKGTTGAEGEVEANERHLEAGSITAGGDEGEDGAEEASKKNALMRTALLTGIAIVLHNLPEGLATFIAAAKDPSVGASLAIAIGVHNIPEGICVAVPIYLATGNRCKAFLWGTASGLAETLAGAAGWIALSQTDGDISSLSYAILFGLVGGMMVYISFRELLRTAYKYDPTDSYTTTVLFSGMAVMAISLSLFVGK